MQEYFLCTDNQKIKISDCLEKCRMETRCMRLPALTVIGYRREWKGIPSTTQLLNGTLYSFLQITKPYCINPREAGFRIMGSTFHALLEENSHKPDCIVEYDFPQMIGKITGTSGRPDLLEKENDQFILCDYKFPGAYSIKKNIGMDWRHVQSRTEKYQRKTKIKLRDGSTVERNAGEWKIAKEWKAYPDQADNFEWTYQLNHYRILLEENDYKVDKIQVQAIARDGGTQTASMYGITKDPYIIDIEHIEDDIICDYYVYKKIALDVALKTEKCTTQCSNRERWGGMRCERFCDVAEFCHFYLYEKSI